MEASLTKKSRRKKEEKKKKKNVYVKESVDDLMRRIHMKNDDNVTCDAKKAKKSKRRKVH